MYNYSGVGYGVNPYQQQLTQNRLNQLEQQYGSYQPNYVQQTQQPQYIQQSIKGRPVSSMEEAKASMIDLDGSLFVFPDIANGMIHTKQVLIDGTAEFKTYYLKSDTNGQVKQTRNTQQYVSIEMFDNAMNDISNKIKKLEGAVSYESNVTGNGKSNDEK